MRAFKFASLTIAAAGAMACMAAAALADPFVSASHGYQLTPAPGWQVHTPGSDGTDVTVVAKPIGNFSANLTVIVTSGAGITLKAGIAAENAQFPKMFPSYKMISQQATKINGIDAVQTVGTYRETRGLGRTFRVRQYLMLNKNFAYIITCTENNASRANYDPSFTSMIKSFRWTS